ncbi:PRTRC system protein B [Pedobacter sp. KBW01]|uniref:PRTRC system protein B n=1 Tax=Pedobacter sp. KBW01 TaxID=2153364 RepID=UPI000F59B7C8|nr:PRTRC system protein B [Pedobacter sp. KBW01]RQO64794.1 PRTRC system protein B [Pedobacter sp. KBW01]
MENLMDKISDLYVPFKALMVYRAESDNSYYVESHDLDNKGMAINAHPLSLKESQSLALALDAAQAKGESFLHHQGLLPSCILHLKTGKDGRAVWHTPMIKKELHFIKGLHIPDGAAYVPPMLWKAERKQLSVWALADNKRPKESTKLYHAPFFNVYENASVCFGNVKIEIPADSSLTSFIKTWEHYFFGSTFSHLIGGGAFKGDLAKLWKEQTATRQKFPVGAMNRTAQTLMEVLK